MTHLKWLDAASLRRIRTETFNLRNKDLSCLTDAREQHNVSFERLESTHHS